MIEIKNNYINVNGKEEFIFGGELHYFRTPKENWRMLIKKTKEAGCNLISTYIPWCWHEYEDGKFDFTGETRAERDLHTFLKIVSEEGLNCIVRPGPYVMSEIKKEGIPLWLLEKHSEIIARDINGKENNTQVISYIHPTYLNRVESWYKEVCGVLSEYQCTTNGSIIMLQLDNEVGMLQWVTNNADYNEVALEYFKAYLKEKYTTMDELNNSLEINARYHGEVIDEYLLQVNTLEEKQALKLGREYSKFMRIYFKKYIEELRTYAKNSGINVPFIVNVHGFEDHGSSGRGLRYPIGLSQLYEAAKVPEVLLAGDYYIRNISFDNYPDLIISNAFTKAIQMEEQPLFSAEFQGGGLSDRPRLQPSDIDLSTRVCIASDMNAINYYMFCSGENYENIGLFGRRHEWQAPLKVDGTVRPHYNKISSIGKTLKAIGSELIKTKRTVDTYIGFYPDYYMTEYKNEKERGVIDNIAGTRDAFQYEGILKSMTQGNIAYDAIDILAKEIDVAKVKSLWVFSNEYMDKDVQEKLKNYVKDGGILVLYPTAPKFELNGDNCTILRDYLNINIKDTKHGWLQPSVLDMDSIFSSCTTILEDVEGEIIARDEEGRPCGFINNVEFGKIVYLGVGSCQDYNYKIELIRKLSTKIGITTVVDVDDMWTSVSLRENQNDKFILLNSFDEEIKALKVKIKGQYAFEGHEVIVGGRSGVILPLGYKISEDIKLNYATAEILSKEINETVVLEFKTIPNYEYDFSIDTNKEIIVDNGELIDKSKNSLKVKAREDVIKIVIK